MKSIYLSILAMAIGMVGTLAQTPVPISQARQVAQGQSVTITGIVINGGSLGPIRYIQDATGGLPVYFPSVTNNWNVGDSVLVTGSMSAFNTLIQIGTVTSHQVIATGRPLPTPKVVLLTAINAANEATLLKVKGVTFANGGGTFAASTLAFTDANGQSSVIYLRSGHPLVGTKIPTAPVDMVGIGSVFSNSYQLLPRDANDIQVAASFYLTDLPTQTNLSKTGFTVSWKTSTAGTTALKYGTAPNALSQLATAQGNTANHLVTLTNLMAGTIYFVQAESVSGSDTARSPVIAFATVSNSSGAIEVYFNQVTDTSLNTGTVAQYLSGSALETKIIDRINQAQTSIDVAMYSINRATIVTALNAAKARGVQVRYVTDNGTTNAAFQTVPPTFTVLPGNSSALMHNKFIVFDADNTAKCWVFAGSMNFTTSDMGDDDNNVLFIQDQSLARAYQLEFEEMWGSKTASPGIFAAKFGADKSNNTPHLFVIGGKVVELYFSPSDGTTNEIIAALQSADNDLAFATFSFTRNELRDAIIAAHAKGVAVRGIIENINDTGGEYQTLLGAGVPVKAATLSGLMHHKYAIVDAAGLASSDPQVVTGSHNWSSAAEESNDENTLIIHDATIANLYAQEFSARWLGMITKTKLVGELKDVSIAIFPNPADSFATIEITANDYSKVAIELFDMKGKQVKTFSMPLVSNSKNQQSIDLTSLAAGTYAVLFNFNGKRLGRWLQIAK